MFLVPISNIYSARLTVARAAPATTTRHAPAQTEQTAHVLSTLPQPCPEKAQNTDEQHRRNNPPVVQPHHLCHVFRQINRGYVSHIWKGDAWRLYGVLMPHGCIRNMDCPDLSYFNEPVKEISYTCVKCGKVLKETVCACGSYAVYATLRTRRAIRGR